MPRSPVSLLPGGQPDLDPRSAQSRADRIQAPLKFIFGSQATWLTYLPDAVTVAEIDSNKLFIHCIHGCPG